jgi:HK97 family phage prohead protease
MSKQNNTIEREQRFLNEVVQFRAEEESRIVFGYAAKFDQLSQNLGWYREKIDKNAFNEALQDDTVALFNHDYNMILARTISNTLKLSIDEIGLRYEFEAPNTQAGNDLIEMLKRGDVQHSSFSFSIQDEKWESDDEMGDIRTVLKVKRLYDVSPVVMPAYKQTDVSIAKRSYDDWKNTKDVQYDDIDIYSDELQLLKSL